MLLYSGTFLLLWLCLFRVIYLFFSVFSLYVAFHSLPESPHTVASFQLPPLCRHLQNFFSGLQLPFAICLWNTHYTVLITWISTWSAWTLFWNAMRNFYIDDVIKSISFGLLTQICHRAKENESPFRRFEQGLLGCSRQGLPVSSENSWQTVCLVLSLYMKHMLWVCWGFCSSSLRDPDSGLQSLSAYVHVGVEHLPSQWLNVSECRCGKVYVSTENQI